MAASYSTGAKVNVMNIMISLLQDNDSDLCVLYIVDLYLG